MPAPFSLKISSACSFDHLYSQVLLPFLGKLDDQRAFNSSYHLLDALKAGFAIYSLKVPSLFQFKNMAQAEEHNLSTVYRIGALPSDNGLRRLLDGLDPATLRPAFGHLLEHVKSLGLLRHYRVWQDYVAVSVDRVEHFRSKKVSCPRCQQRNHRDGSSSYFHSMLSAAIVKPGRSEVMPIDHEPINLQDGSTKNDCERVAIHRLLDNFERAHSPLNTIFVLDALSSCAPVIERLEKRRNWRYLIGIKEKGNAHLFAQFDDLDTRHQVNWVTGTSNGQQLSIGYVNGLQLNASNSAVKTNVLYARVWDRKGNETVFSFITNIKLTKKNVVDLLATGRSRWKIENETFNTLKNQGYHFEHNYGHGQKHLCTIMAYLMMLAFWVDQLQQLANGTFQAIHRELKTRVKLWDGMRSVFKMIPVNSMQNLYEKLIEVYCVRLI